MDRHSLRQRYTYLWTGEALAAFLFAALLLGFAYRDGVWQHWIARSYSVCVVIIILMQAVIWWRAKLRLLETHQRQLPVHLLKAYMKWKRINWVLIAGFPFFVLVTTRLTNQPFVSTDTLLGAIFLGGAVLEQINYYYVQLMYDSVYDWNYLRTYRRLRPGAIGKMLDESRSTFSQ